LEESTANVLVITKDNVTFPSVKDVVFTSISDLGKKHVAYEKKRELVKNYDLFMADKRVVESLPKILGKVFYKKKKHPIPIDWNKFESEYTEIVNSALIYQGRGTCKYLLFI
jgi:ribosome biogenesis protein UTP30